MYWTAYKELDLKQRDSHGARQCGRERTRTIERKVEAWTRSDHVGLLSLKLFREFPHACFFLFVHNSHCILSLADLGLELEYLVLECRLACVYILDPAK